MKIYRLLLVLIVLSAGPLGARCAETSAKGTKPMAPLERFVGGQWVVDGRWDAGEPLHARSIYEWGVNQKMIKARTYVRNGSTEYQRYEAVFGWDPKRKHLFETSFAFDGDVSNQVIEVADNDTLKIGWTPFSADDLPKVRQTLHFTSADSFVWTVWVKQKGDWKRIIEATWRRQ